MIRSKIGYWSRRGIDVIVSVFISVVISVIIFFATDFIAPYVLSQKRPITDRKNTAFSVTENAVNPHPPINKTVFQNTAISLVYMVLCHNILYMPLTDALLYCIYSAPIQTAPFFFYFISMGAISNRGGGGQWVRCCVCIVSGGSPQENKNCCHLKNQNNTDV